MNVEKLYELMQQLIEHDRMKDEIHDAIRAELDVKVGDIKRSPMFGNREIVKIEPLVRLHGFPQRWELAVKVVMQRINKSGKRSSLKPTQATNTICKDWMVALPKPSERRPTVKEMAATQAEGDRAMAAFVASQHGFAHGQGLVERDPERRKYERRAPRTDDKPQSS